jgi:predicted RecB family nuclease
LFNSDPHPLKPRSSFLFEAHLKCPTKCWLRSKGEPTAGNAYAEWAQIQSESYRTAAGTLLTAEVPTGSCAVGPTAEDLKYAKWRLAVNVDILAQASTPESSGSVPLLEQEPGEAPVDAIGSDGTSALHSCVHAIQRVVSEGRGKAAEFIPIRFIFTNKLAKDDRLLLAFDAFVIAEMLGRETRLGKIIHGDDHAMLKVKTAFLAGEVRKRVEKIAALLSSPVPPDLVLNRHCAECEFQARCRQKAIERDDLSLLAGMSEKERTTLHRKGIFTVTQLSYTFRPRRRPKRLRDKREKYHHSLKALAIREKKIHIVGNPELKIEGTPVYLDVEGLPDRDFYYLIGLCIGNGESAVQQHSLWADTVEDEARIWREFLGLLETVEKPVLIHCAPLIPPRRRAEPDHPTGPAQARAARLKPPHRLALSDGPTTFLRRPP